MSMTVLLQTSRVSAEATVERLQAAEIDAQVLDQPNLFVRLTTGGNYRVRVGVPDEELARARAELERWESEAGPRVEGLASEVGRVLGGLSVGALLLGGGLLALGVWWGPLAALGAWLLGVAVWVMRSRGREEGA